METAGAYGGGKAGGAFDPQAFIQRPPVIVRAVCWVRLPHYTLVPCTKQCQLNIKPPCSINSSSFIYLLCVMLSYGIYIHSY